MQDHGFGSTHELDVYSFLYVSLCCLALHWDGSITKGPYCFFKISTVLEYPRNHSQAEKTNTA